MGFKEAHNRDLFLDIITMSVSIYTRIGKIVKKITGIKDISLMKKNIHKNVGKLIYHKKYNAKDIVNVMVKLGMKKGSTVCIHASMKEFYNYNGTAEELIREIQHVLTPEGTLMMPAYPDIANKDLGQYIFNPETDETAAGYLAETFRKSPDVIRSINVQHSVCAWGKHAEWLTKDHQYGKNCWDEHSPYFRMTQIGALVFDLGMPDFFIGTFDHCVEAILYKEHPYWKQFFSKEQTYQYYDKNGNICHYTCLTGNIDCRSREKKLTRHFSHDIYKKEKLSNLHIKVFHAAPCLDIMLKLGRKGVTMYYVPSPNKYTF